MWIDGTQQAKYYRDAIMESLNNIDSVRYRIGAISRDSLNRILCLTEAYSVLCSTNNIHIDECESFIRITERLVKEFKYRNRTLNEGFENPFDTDDDVDINFRYDDKCDGIPDDAITFKRIRLDNPDKNGKVMYKDGKVVATHFFAPNDTIEICPVRLIAPSDMYSRTVRDFAFEIDPENGVYGIPFGYGSYYRSNLDCNLEPNADYIYDAGAGSNGRSIRIFATRPIRKGNEIVLKADRDMFDNEFNDSDFRYDKEPFYAIKNVTVA